MTDVGLVRVQWEQGGKSIHSLWCCGWTVGGRVRVWRQEE